MKVYVEGMLEQQRIQAAIDLLIRASSGSQYLKSDPTPRPYASELEAVEVTLGSKGGIADVRWSYREPRLTKAPQAGKREVRISVKGGIPARRRHIEARVQEMLSELAEVMAEWGHRLGHDIQHMEKEIYSTRRKLEQQIDVVGSRRRSLPEKPRHIGELEWARWVRDMEFFHAHEEKWAHQGREGQWVAVYNQSDVDWDNDEAVLTRRIRRKYGGESVYIGGVKTQAEVIPPFTGPGPNSLVR